MKFLLLIVSLGLMLFSNLRTDSPHGAEFKITCSTCHSSKGWMIDKEIYSFDHNSTQLPLAGQHKYTECRQCHPTLIFSEAETECFSCHNDVHHGSVGYDCSRCHTPESWLVNNINTIHRASRFPLLGAHITADCYDCHKSESNTRFDVSGIECIDCHREDYNSTQNPNHIQAGISTDCMSCHSIASFEWSGAGFSHSFFPLTLGHAIEVCTDCHTSSNYSTISAECYSCHQPEYESSSEPNHTEAAFSINCTECHTTNPDWKPTQYNHSEFLLTLGHSGPTCADCHKGSYTNTSGDCYACHQQDFLGAKDPDHVASGFPQTCTACHTTNPGWTPASFDHSSFPLTLGHSGPSCSDCHKGSYINTPSDCYDCHAADYNESENPSHPALDFSTTCTLCHTTHPDWKPATYKQHDSQFPIYSGKHQGEWNSCSDCHTNISNYSVFSCINCHEHNKADMDDEHIGEVSGYSYNSSECFRCHPRGDTD